MTLAQYAEAAKKLAGWDIALRSFVLLQPPFLPPDEALPWACRSIDFAQDCGATAVALIPTRGGNGAMEMLARAGDFAAPDIRLKEEALHYGVRQERGRVFVDLWEFEKVACCEHCREPRRRRLERINLSQHLEPPIVCAVCGASA